MLIYNLTAEYVSLLVIAIVIISLAWNKESPSPQRKMFSLMYIACFISIVCTIVSTLTSQYFALFPIWLHQLLKSLYYILAPSVSLFIFLYTLTITEVGTSKKVSTKIWLLYSVPYQLYVLLILSNYIYPNVFSFNNEVGYCRGPLFQSTYVIAVIYIIGVYLLVIKHRHKGNRSILMIMAVNITISATISFIQLFYSQILLAGTASTTGILIAYLYIQNSKATTDKLTGLYNRQTLTSILDKFAQNKTNLSLYLFSIQNFKSINERYGLEIGDEILITIGQLFLKTFDKESVFRYSGDEFMVVINETNKNYEKKINTIVERFNEVFIIHEKEIKISIFYTRVDYPLFSKNVKTLISTADYAISKLKENSFNSNYLYDYSICSEMQRQSYIIEVLKQAIENDGFEIHYQPIYSVASQNFPQAEALIRLKNNEEDNIYPGEFIPVAEKSGLIIKITYIVLEKACQDFRKMIDLYGENRQLTSISINFPYKIFFQDDMLTKVMSILNKYSILPSQIKIEITERSLISDDKTVKRIISKMKEKNFLFELDDFGIEYSNMSVFLKLPINYIKIDKSLVDVSVANIKYRPFFQNLVNGIHSLGKSIIVEGVEDEEQLDFIQKCGCRHIQGYIFSRPLPIKDLQNFLQK